LHTAGSDRAGRGSNYILKQPSRPVSGASFWAWNVRLVIVTQNLRHPTRVRSPLGRPGRLLGARHQGELARLGDQARAVLSRRRW